MMEPSPSGQSQAQGDVGVGGMQSAGRFGVLGKPPPGWGPHKTLREPPKSCLHHAECSPVGATWTGTWSYGTGHCGDTGKAGWSGDPMGTDPKSLGKSQGTAVGSGQSTYPHPDGCAPPQTRGSGRGQTGGCWGPLHPAASRCPRGKGLGTPRGFAAAIKVQLRFFAFGTMATFPTWLNYRAGCCLRGGLGGVCLFAAPQSQGCRTEAKGNPWVPTGAGRSLPSRKGASSRSSPATWLS